MRKRLKIFDEGIHESVVLLSCGSVAALVSCFCLVIVAAVIVLSLGALFLLFVVLFP